MWGPATSLVLVLLAQNSWSSPHFQTRTYSGYRVYRSLPSSTKEQEVLERILGEDVDTCEVLKRAHKPGVQTDFMCEMAGADRVEERARREGVELEILNSDLGGVIREQEELKGGRVKREGKQMGWSKYQRYDTILTWMEQLASDHPEFITFTNMGSSHEDRKIPMVKVGKSPLGNLTRAVWVDGGIHAREWIAVATTTYLLDKVVQTFLNNDTSTCETRSVQDVDWYFAPVLNPDGYEYSHTNDRMWRKNRSPPPSGSSCYGTDLNRNWDVIGFGLGVTSSNPCRETYKGTGKNSEPETVAAAETLQKYRENIRIYLTFHSYGQYWLNSWGYKTELAVDDDKLIRLGRQAVEALQCVNPNRNYVIGSAGAIFYVAGGASDDYAKAAAEIPYSFTVELPDEGRYGFILPAAQIEPVGAEMWAALGVLAKEAARHPLGRDPARDAEMEQDRKKGLTG